VPVVAIFPSAHGKDPQDSIHQLRFTCAWRIVLGSLHDVKTAYFATRTLKLRSGSLTKLASFGLIYGIKVCSFGSAFATAIRSKQRSILFAVHHRQSARFQAD
jgi:hypothetical protein